MSQTQWRSSSWPGQCPLSTLLVHRRGSFVAGLMNSTACIDISGAPRVLSNASLCGSCQVRSHLGGHYYWILPWPISDFVPAIAQNGFLHTSNESWFKGRKPSNQFRLSPYGVSQGRCRVTVLRCSCLDHRSTQSGDATIERGIRKSALMRADSNDVATRSRSTFSSHKPPCWSIINAIILGRLFHIAVPSACGGMYPLGTVW